MQMYHDANDNVLFSLPLAIKSVYNIILCRWQGDYYHLEYKWLQFEYSNKINNVVYDD